METDTNPSSYSNFIPDQKETKIIDQKYLKNFASTYNINENSYIKIFNSLKEKTITNAQLLAFYLEKKSFLLGKEGKEGKEIKADKESIKIQDLTECFGNTTASLKCLID